jgi:tetratricopeptide (TPR) repeat protein
VAQARQGDVEAARRTFESLRGQGADVDRALAELYLAAGRAAAALALLEPLAGASPDDADVQALYGTALVRMGRLDDGAAALGRALELEPGQALATRSLALLEQQRQLTGEAEIVFGEEAGAAFQQGLYALDVEDYAAAAQAFARSRAIEDNALAAFYHGYARQLQGETRAAIADYEVALEAFPDSDIVLNNLGYAQLELGRFDLALEYLRRAVAANPSNARAHLNLGLVRFATGQYDSAIASFEEAARLDPRLESTTEQLIVNARERSGE